MTLNKLISEAKHKSNAAQQLLFDRLSARAKMLCMRYVKNNEDAEEIMLDGFFKFFSSLANFRYTSDEAVYAYVKKIMVNECLMKLRKTNNFTMVAESEISDIPLNDQVVAKMAATEIYQLVLQLPVGYRTVFNLFAIEGYEHREIASVLEITESTSRSQLTRARCLLQKMLSSNTKTYERERSK